MFNETCNPGEIATNVGADAPICLTPAEAAAYMQSMKNTGAAPSSISTYIPWIAAAVLGLFIVGSMGRR